MSVECTEVTISKSMFLDSVAQDDRTRKIAVIRMVQSESLGWSDLVGTVTSNYD